ncbi:hypothetical protein JVT61DRAFT_9056 [Boletus reticuloceps]|uniref:FACT complex subunit n=1 Tax=Boletus reticuloceps TaxID=495285 RepID=A0A8I2YH98_9AGAM|nr:hypothetical protein JVT61DRAFT_12579 [Boletus reticuloceps]KAG6371712.1 hypothetical protein JVT61DRAFT_9056 [Boletus reticuloceps]
MSPASVGANKGREPTGPVEIFVQAKAEEPRRTRLPSSKLFQSYKGEGALPKEAETLRLFVDHKAQTIILPTHGFAVPFHISTIKYISKNDEGDYTYHQFLDAWSTCGKEG